MFGNDKIDIVIPWVDDNDPEWRAERDKWKNKISNQGGLDEGANNNLRYESWDNLQYWFRSVEQNMPWFNKIFFVTWGHIPDFLNTSHPKLRIVKHKDYIPAGYLPTFNSNTIEMNYHRIEDLSENFIIFNDDMFILQPTKESYYFKNNLVCDSAIETPVMPVPADKNDSNRQWGCHIQINNILFINRHFNKRDVQSKHYDKWFCSEYEEFLERNKSMSYWNNFCGFQNPHVPSAMKKSILKHLWHIEPYTLDQASQNKFRYDTDVNQFLIRYWQFCEGNFLPRKTLGKAFTVNINNCKEIAEIIKAKKLQAVCTSEYCVPEEFVQIKRVINAAFNEIFPNKSSFEK